MNNRITLITLLVLLVLGIRSSGQECKLKVITYNIWNGFDFGKDENRREKLVEWVKSQNPEILGLQELCNYSPDKLQEDAEKWGHNYSILLKEQGYSVGLTSKFPIELKEKIMDGMHHGALHCKTAGIDVFVIHFSPSSYKKRQEEAKIILQKLEEIAGNNPNYLIMGDFNSHSPFDADYYKNDALLNKYLKSENNKNDKGNLANNKLDYSVASSFLAFPLIDVCQRFTNGIAERGSFPGRILKTESKETDNEIVARLERIDYIMVSPKLAEKCVASKVFNGQENWMLSDHYPVMAEFVGVGD
jgi:endonuclease/exonuclease/phosphatase family metal-dependent hydrolase